MKYLLNKIREIEGLTSQELCHQLSISSATMHRLENGCAASDKTLLLIYNYCIQHKIPIDQIVSERIAKAESSIQKSNGYVYLYHGSKSGIEGSIMPLSRSRCDFGKGFYMGTIPDQALMLVCGFPKPKFYVTSLNMNGLKKLDISAKLEWAMLIAYHRGKMERIKDTSFYKKYASMLNGYDVVCGYIANDRMFYVLDSFFEGYITDQALVASLSVLKLGKQYVCITQRGCDHVKIERECLMTPVENMYIRQQGEQNRLQGIVLADDICKRYRREGRFFDEIIDEATRRDV